MNEKHSKASRRRFLEMVGIAGGSAAVYETMTAMGLIRVPQAWGGPPQIPNGAGAKVLILGAGIGGLTTAYELTRAGYQCEILEAQNRAGGRNLTARRGTIITEHSAEHGTTTQECRFDEGLYLNVGPGRLPHHHRRALHYCQELGVALEIYVMESTANLFQTDKAFDGLPQRTGHIANDTRGYISELLAKATQRHTLDDELNEGDRDNLLDLLKVFGDLGDGNDFDGVACNEFTYCGTERSSCQEPYTIFQTQFEDCRAKSKHDLKTLLNSKFWQRRFYQPLEHLWQPTMFQPVGGMDRLVTGFLNKVGHLISYQSEVTEIRLLKDGVKVIFKDRFGNSYIKKADYCISNIPLPGLKKIKANFSADFNSAIAQSRYEPSCKVGWQANKRFWESNENQIYGGISWIDHMITQMWYPSYDYFTEKGTMTGAYNFGEDAFALGKMSLQERLLKAREGAIKLHPEFNDNNIVPMELGLSIAWQNIPYSYGLDAEWSSISAEDAKAYTRLLAPDGRFHVIGDQVSPLPGWQEGAMMSAEHVMEQISGKRPLTVPTILQAPDSRKMREGIF